jgi:hypothetical protein
LVPALLLLLTPVTTEVLLLTPVAAEDVPVLLLVLPVTAEDVEVKAPTCGMKVATGILAGRLGNGASKRSTLTACLIDGLRLRSG